MSDLPDSLFVAEPIAGAQPAVGSALWVLEAARARLKRSLVGFDEALLNWSPDPA